jgi:hypothetical protein
MENKLIIFSVENTRADMPLMKQALTIGKVRHEMRAALGGRDRSVTGMDAR